MTGNVDDWSDLDAHVRQPRAILSNWLNPQQGKKMTSPPHETDWTQSVKLTESPFKLTDPHVRLTGPILSNWQNSVDMSNSSSSSGSHLVVGSLPQTQFSSRQFCHGLHLSLFSLPFLHLPVMFSTFSLSLMLSFLTWSHSVWPHAHLHIFISVTSSFFMWELVTSTVSIPYSIAGWTIVLCIIRYVKLTEPILSNWLNPPSQTNWIHSVKLTEPTQSNWLNPPSQTNWTHSVKLTEPTQSNWLNPPSQTNWTHPVKQTEPTLSNWLSLSFQTDWTYHRWLHSSRNA